MIKNLVLVGAGGAAGSMLRYAVWFFTARYFSGHFPLATFIVNITGCFLIGLMIGVFGGDHEARMRLLLVTGFCGGYTTFSAFSLENLTLMNNGQVLTSAAYILASVVCGLAAVWLGFKLV